MGANPCKPMSGKPTVATVPHNCARYIGGRLVVAVRKNIVSLVTG